MFDWNDILFFGAYNVLYAFYVELHPGLGKIILRSNSEGKYSINLSSFFNFITTPLNFKKKNIMKMFWQPKNLDINYVFTTLYNTLNIILMDLKLSVKYRSNN